MITQQLTDYIRTQLETGRTRENITKSLQTSGWQIDDIQNAFVHVITDANTQAPVLFGPTDLLISAWHLYRQRLKIYISITVISEIVSLIPVGFLIIYVWFEGISSYDTLVPLIFFLLFIGTIVVVSILQLWMYITLIIAIDHRDEKIGVLDAFKMGWGNVLSYWWLSFLKGLAILSGFIFLIIPGIIFSLQLFFAGYILILENVRGANALLKSKAYAKGRLGQIFWRICFFALLTGIISFILDMIPFIIMFMINPAILGEALKNGSAVKNSAPLLGYGINFVAFILLIPISAIYFYLLFTNLRSVKGPFVFVPSKRSKLFLFLEIIIIILIIIIVPILVSRLLFS